jgi:hypothetical protein
MWNTLFEQPSAVQLTLTVSCATKGTRKTRGI